MILYLLCCLHPKNIAKILTGKTKNKRRVWNHSSVKTDIANVGAYNNTNGTNKQCTAQTTERLIAVLSR